MKQEKEQPPQAITFKTAIMLSPEGPGLMSRLIEAGSPSPWFNIADVPASLRALVGKPDFSIPADTPNQHWVSRQQLDAEKAAFEALARGEGDGTDPAVRAALGAMDSESFARIKARAETVVKNENAAKNPYEK